jgi:phage terminase small subunit
MARVVRTRAACAQAGNPHRHASRLANRPQVKQRIDEIVEERTWGGSRDLVGLIGQLKILLESTKKVKSAAAMMAAKAIISEAARLKLLLPRDEPMAVDDRLENLTQEEWTRRYGPPAP